MFLRRCKPKLQFNSDHGPQNIDVVKKGCNIIMNNLLGRLLLLLGLCNNVPRLHHRVQSERSWMREGEPEGTVRRLSRLKQIHLCLAELPPYQLHHLGVEPSFPGSQPLSRQDVCSYIVGPRDVSCSKRQQLPLGPQEDSKVSSTLPRHESIAT